MNSGRIGTRITRLEAIQNARETARKAEEAERHDREADSSIEATPFESEVLAYLEEMDSTLACMWDMLKEIRDKR